MAEFTKEALEGFSFRDKLDLSGRVAVVTGGATGLGLAITRCLVSAGAKVAVLSSHEKNAENLREFRDRAVHYCFDITDTDHTEEMAKRILDKEGHVDILVNNAGIHCKKPIEEMSVQDYSSVLDVHLIGAFALTRAFVPQMKEHAWGRILFMASMTSYIGQPQISGYATAKAGILGLVHVLTIELAPYGITVNAIAPGWIDTPMLHKATDKDPARLAKIMGRIPAGQLGHPMDVGMTAAFLCSDAARYISGSCIPVDGGALIGF